MGLTRDDIYYQAQEDPCGIQEMLKIHLEGVGWERRLPQGDKGP